MDGLPLFYQDRPPCVLLANAAKNGEAVELIVIEMREEGDAAEHARDEVALDQLVQRAN